MTTAAPMTEAEQTILRHTRDGLQPLRVVYDAIPDEQFLPWREFTAAVVSLFERRLVHLPKMDDANPADWSAEQLAYTIVHRYYRFNAIARI